MKLLVIEDSDRLRRSLAVGLTKVGFATDVAADGEAGLAFLDAYDYDVVILDLMLPGIGGLEILETLRSRGHNVHVLILSAKDQVEDRVRGLEMGADDYLVKPFSFDELCARIQALIRRRYEAKSPRLTVGPVVVDTARREVTRDGRPISVTKSEYTLLEALMRRAGHVLSKRQLEDYLYDGATEVSSNVVEVLISNLRRKLHVPGEPPLIHTRRGYGYLIDSIDSTGSIDRA